MKSGCTAAPAQRSPQGGMTMLTSLIESRGEAQRCLLCCRAVSYHGFAEMSTVFPGFLRKMLKTARPWLPPGGSWLRLKAETEGVWRQVRCCFAPILTRTENRYGILPPLKGLGGFAAVAVGFADSSLPEGAEGPSVIWKNCEQTNHFLFISAYSRRRLLGLHYA